jgi:hypothetical protein
MRASASTTSSQVSPATSRSAVVPSGSRMTRCPVLRRPRLTMVTAKVRARASGAARPTRRVRARICAKNAPSDRHVEGALYSIWMPSSPCWAHAMPVAPVTARVENRHPMGDGRRMGLPHETSGCSRRLRGWRTGPRGSSRRRCLPVWGSIEGGRHAQRILPLRSGELRGHQRSASARRVSLLPMPEAIGPFLCVHRRPARRSDDSRRRRAHVVSLFREGATRFLFHVRLVTLLGPTREGLDRHRHGGVRSADGHPTEDSYLRGRQGRLLRHCGRPAAKPALTGAGEASWIPARPAEQRGRERTHADHRTARVGWTRPEGSGLAVQVSRRP